MASLPPMSKEDRYRVRRRQRCERLTLLGLARELELAITYADDGAEKTAAIIIETVSEELRNRHRKGGSNG